MASRFHGRMASWMRGNSCGWLPRIFNRKGHREGAKVAKKAFRLTPALSKGEGGTLLDT